MDTVRKHRSVFHLYVHQHKDKRLKELGLVKMGACVQIWTAIHLLVTTGRRQEPVGKKKTAGWITDMESSVDSRRSRWLKLLLKCSRSKQTCLIVVNVNKAFILPRC